MVMIQNQERKGGHLVITGEEEWDEGVALGMDHTISSWL